MAKLNINRVRLRDHRAMMKFERKYQKLIYSALIDSVKPAIASGSSRINESAIKDVYVKMYEEIGVYFAKYNFEFMGSLNMKAESSFFLDSWSKWMRAYATSTLANKVVEINDTTRDKIKAVLAEASELEISTRSVIGKMIEDKTLGAIGRRRAKTIARTETAAAANEGKEKSGKDWAEDSDSKLYKFWVSGGSKEPRPSHQDADNGKAIPADSMFIVDGEEMSRPHDPGASAGNIVNCNCTVIYVSETYARQNGML